MANLRIWQFRIFTMVTCLSKASNIPWQTYELGIFILQISNYYEIKPLSLTYYVLNHFIYLDARILKFVSILLV